MTDDKDINERGCYIIARALDEFIRLEQTKPTDDRRVSDEQNAVAILHARFDKELAILAQSDEEAGRVPPDCERKPSISG